MFSFEMLCCVLAWMNEYIVQIISATTLWLISRYSHHTLKKSRKMTAKNGQTENFEQPKNDSIASESPETSRVFRFMHLHCTAILGFFQRSFARNLKNISPIVWYCCNIWRPYKISNILYKTNEKAVSFLSTTSGTSRDLSCDALAFIFPAAWRVFIRKHWNVCCSLLQWCDVGTVVWCRTCTVRFFGSLLRLFSSFPPIWVCKMKVLWKVASSRAKDDDELMINVLRCQLTY